MHRPGVRRTGLGANDAAENLEPPITGHRGDSLSAETQVAPRCQPIGSRFHRWSELRPVVMLHVIIAGAPTTPVCVVPPPLTTLPQRLPR